MQNALSKMVVEGIKTSIPSYRELMVDRNFTEGNITIHYLTEKLNEKEKAKIEENLQI